jgi:hypothetical protein
MAAAGRPTAGAGPGRAGAGRRVSVPGDQCPSAGTAADRPGNGRLRGAGHRRGRTACPAAVHRSAGTARDRSLGHPDCVARRRLDPVVRRTAPGATARAVPVAARRLGNPNHRATVRTAGAPAAVRRPGVHRGVHRWDVRRMASEPRTSVPPEPDLPIGVRTRDGRDDRVPIPRARTSGDPDGPRLDPATVCPFSPAGPGVSSACRPGGRRRQPRPASTSRRQRWPSLVSSTAMPCARSSFRSRSEAAQSRAARAVTR